ncbi:hypothetical protein JOM56_013590 [Amanita muscaria]
MHCVSALLDTIHEWTSPSLSPTSQFSYIICRRCVTCMGDAKCRVRQRVVDPWRVSIMRGLWTSNRKLMGPYGQFYPCTLCFPSFPELLNALSSQTASLHQVSVLPGVSDSPSHSRNTKLSKSFSFNHCQPFPSTTTFIREDICIHSRAKME